MAGNRAGAIQQAVTLHRQGRLGEAEHVYSAILAAEPGHFDALHLLGVLMHQRGRSADALALIAKAITANARSADAHANLGRVLAAVGRLDEALASHDKALALKPDHAEALFHRGNALIGLRRHAEALASYDRALGAAPGYVPVHMNRGVALRALGRPAEALESYDRALAIMPDAVEVHANRGNALLDLKRPAEALACYDRALAAQPNNVDALYNRGNALLALKRPADALTEYEKALVLMPQHASAMANLGATLRSLKRPQEALAAVDRALALGLTQAAEVHTSRGNVLGDLNRHDEALTAFDAALALRPDYAEAMINRGNALMNLRRADEALASYDAVLACEPEHPEARYNKGLVWLATGDFTRGWPAYEWRAKKHEDNDVRVFLQPRWTGAEPLAGQTILLHAEQGFGDAIQFIRYAPLVAAKGATVVVEAPRSLHALISSVDGVRTVVSRGDEPPPFDCHCPLLSLPLVFGTTLDTIPAQVPYLDAPPERIEAWRQRLPGDGSLRVGIAWSGNPTHSNDHNRSIALDRVVGLSYGLGIQLIGIQRDLRSDDLEALQRHPQLVSLGAELTDFADTAAVISLLDLVICVDTSVAHLAGALGKPVWIMLPYNGDWRWLLEGDTTPWYPTARLFRQPAVGDWDSVLARVRSELSHFQR